MTDEGRIVLAALVEQVRAADLAQSLAQVDETVQTADWQGQQGEMVCDLLADLFECQVMAAGEDDSGLTAFGQDEFLQQESACLGAVEFFDDLAGSADFA